MVTASLILAGHLLIGYVFSEMARIGQKELYGTEMSVRDWMGGLILWPIVLYVGREK